MKKNPIQLPTYSSSLFTWVKKTGATEISTLESNCIKSSCNFSNGIGFNVKSEKTGRVLTFILISAERFDGEVVSWHYQDVNNMGIQLTVFND